MVFLFTGNIKSLLFFLLGKVFRCYFFWRVTVFCNHQFELDPEPFLDADVTIIMMSLVFLMG